MSFDENAEVCIENNDFLRISDISEPDNVLVYNINNLWWSKKNNKQPTGAPYKIKHVQRFPQKKASHKIGIIEQDAFGNNIPSRRTYLSLANYIYHPRTLKPTRVENLPFIKINDNQNMNVLFSIYIKELDKYILNVNGLYVSHRPHTQKYTLNKYKERDINDLIKSVKL